MAEAQKRGSVLVNYHDAHEMDDEIGFGLSGSGNTANDETHDPHKHMTQDDKDHDDNEQAHHEGWNSLEGKHRGRCTDMIFLILIVVMWYCMTMLGFVCLGWIKDDRIAPGNIHRLINSMDFNGKICGYDDAVKDLNNAYYMPDGSVVCVKDCPKATDYEKFICRYGMQAESDAATLAQQYKMVNDYECMYELKTIEFINRCWPDVNAKKAFTQASVVSAAAGTDLASYAVYDPVSNAHTTWFNDFVQDLWAVRGYVFGFGIGFSVLIAFVYIWLLHVPGLLFTIIWGLILAIQLLLIAGAWSLYKLAMNWDGDAIHTDNEIKTMYIFSYIMMAFAAIYFCVMVVMRKRIELAIEVVKEAAAAMAHMPVIMLMPMVQTAGLTIFLVFWMIYVLMLASSGDIQKHTTPAPSDDAPELQYRTFSYGDNSKYALLYFIFCYFWTSEFIIAIGQLTIALSFTAYYFSRDKSTVGNGTVWWAMKTTFSTHLGTCAYGSLVLAIVRTIKVVVMYMVRQAKKSENKCLEYVLKCLICCLTCIEKIIKFINKHAYILVAIYGYNFCKACRRAFFLLLRNILRVSAVNMVAFLVLAVGKLFVPLATTFACYCTLAYAVPFGKFGGIVSPCCFVFVLSYFISIMFSELFGMGIETILFCYIADEEMFAPENRFAEAGLIKTIKHVENRKKEIKAIEKSNRENFKNSVKQGLSGKGGAPQRVPQAEMANRS